MKLHVKQNMNHFIKDMFADILRAQSLMKSEIEYEGLFQIVAAELRAAKYCWDELYKKADDPSEKILANVYEVALRAKIASLMHAANILVEAQHMVEQGYPFKTTEQSAGSDLTGNAGRIRSVDRDHHEDAASEGNVPNQQGPHGLLHALGRRKTHARL